LLAELTEVEDSGNPPVLSGVQVLKVQRGVFLSVTIGWQTDTLTNALVRYGVNDLLQKSEPGKRLGREHQVVLFNLQADKTYRYTAISQDLFGRSQSSPPLTFSTSNPFTVLPQDDAGNLSESEAEIVIASHFQRLGPDYLLELTLDPAASVFIGSSGTPRSQEPADESSSRYEAEEAHDGLSGEAVVSMDACYSCHQSQSTATHPVNIYPKPGMIIPPEYPTLPDGRITCNSCHSLHSSEFEFISRKEGKRELCVGCHKDMM
jgi:predicted CXXCH cytochrome family protein